jgi:DNA-directed RNA polymerase beta subunit
MNLFTFNENIDTNKKKKIHTVAAMLDDDDHIEEVMIRGTPGSSTATPKLTKKQQATEDEWVKNIRNLTQPHTASFDRAITHDIHKMINRMAPATFQHETGNENKGMQIVTVKVVGIDIQKPEMPLRPNVKLLPSQCRAGRLNYQGKLSLAFEVTVEQEESDTYTQYTVEIEPCHVPVMVMSSLCHLQGMNAEELINAGEEPYEAGGHFIIGGTERCMRLLYAPKRNYVCEIIHCIISFLLTIII